MVTRRSVLKASAIPVLASFAQLGPVQRLGGDASLVSGLRDNGAARTGAAAFAPDDLSDLKLWLRADAADATTDEEHIDVWPDQSGNDNDCSQNDAGVKPRWSATGIAGRPEVTMGYQYVENEYTVYCPRQMAIPSIALDRQDVTYVLIGRPTSRESVSTYGVALRATSDALNFGWGPTGVACYDGTNVRHTTRRCPHHTHMIGLTSTSSALKLWVGDRSEAFSPASSGNITLSTLGSTGNPLYGALSEVMVFDRALTDAEMWQLQDYADAKYGLPKKTVVCDGDSLTTGYASRALRNYPGQLWGMLGPTWQMYNVAKAGEHVGSMITSAATDVDPLYVDEPNAQNVLVLWGGLLDAYYTPGDDAAKAAAAIANIEDYCEDRQAAGWQVVVCTVLPSNFISETARSTINASIRANWTNYADELADLAADANIGTYSSTYYRDEDVDYTTHMTSLGFEVVASIVKDAIDSL